MVAIMDEHKYLITSSLVLLAALALAVALRFTQVVTIPFVLAIFIAIFTVPLLDAQVVRLKFPRSIAFVVTILVVMAVMAVICLLVAQAIQTILTTTSQYSKNFTSFVEQLFVYVNGWGIELNQQEVISAARQKIPLLVTNTFGTVLGFLSSVFLTAIFTIFLLAGRNPYVIHKGFYAKIDIDIRRYITIKVVTSTVTGLLVWLFLALFKLELAAVFGMLAFLLNFIPSIGSAIATFLPLPVAIVQFDNPLLIILVVVIPGSVQIVIGNIIEPKLMGRSLNLHPVAILAALSFWGLIWGIVGMFLAVPLTAILRTVFLQFDTLRPVGKLMGGEVPSTGEPDASTS